MTRYGYADKNIGLQEEEGVRANRGMQKKTFQERGIEYAGELAEENCRGLERILEWNIENGIGFYRITSSFIPWHNRYELEELPNYGTIEEVLGRIGERAEKHSIRLTFHPGHFVKLASPTGSVVEKAVNELDVHGKILDLMGAEKNPYNSINIHIGAHYSDKEATGRRFCENYRRLSEPARKRLTVENDDKESLWSVSELIDAVHERIGIPVVYDRLHHRFSGRGMTHEEAARAAADTWDERPIIHYSESRQEHGEEETRAQSHSDYVDGPIRTYSTGADVMIEAKAKEKAVLRYRDSA
jgi:UV DNA damage endonuclease